MKIYARQIAPEYQESPLSWTDAYPENVILTGNRQYNSHTTDAYKTINSNFEDMAGQIADFDTDVYKCHAEIVADYMQGREWTPEQVNEWVKLANEYNARYQLDDIMCRALELFTGMAYDDTTIRGSCQGDWQNMYYPVEYGPAFVKNFEIEYFNLGSEWIVHDEDTTPEDADDITGYSTYCYSWNEDGIKAEIAALTDSTPEDVTLYVFDDYKKVPQYHTA